MVVGAAVLASAAAVVVDEVLTSPRVSAPGIPWMLAVFLGVFTVTNAFAVWTARSLGLPSFLLLSAAPSRRCWARFVVYGIGAGFLIYLTNKSLYLTTAASPFRPSAVYDLDTHFKVFALSARAALSEETMFRLFAIPFLVSVGMRFHGWRPRFGFESGPAAPPPAPARPPRAILVVAVLVSALAFGFAHALNPLAATGFGVLLGVIYLRGGWESAVTAHFLGNYLLFAGIYL